MSFIVKVTYFIIIHLSLHFKDVVFFVGFIWFFVCSFFDKERWVGEVKWNRNWVSTTA